MIGRFRPYRSLLQPHYAKLFGGMAAGLIAGAASGAGVPFLTGKIFPLIFPDEDGNRAQPEAWFSSAAELVGIDLTPSNLAILACALLPLVFTVRGIATFFSSYLITYTGSSVLEAIRLRTFAKLQRLPLAFHARHRGGDLMSRLMGDTTQLQQALVQASTDIIVQPFTLVWAMGFIIYWASVNQGIGVILGALISVPLCIVPIRIVSKKLVRKARALQAQSGDLNAVLNENLASQPEIRAYTMEEAQTSSFSSLGKRFVKLTMKTVKYKQLTSPLIEIISTIGIGFAIYFGSRNGLTLEQFLPIIAALFLCYEPVKKLGAVQNKYRQGEASLDRLEVILNASEGMPEPKQPQTWTTVDGRIQFQDVSFSYVDEPTLTDLTFDIPAGQTIALVGSSGAGKTTVVNLIERFYDISSGSISIDGIDIRDVTLHHLRDQIAYVSQSPVLFSGTISENIAIGRPGSSQADIEQAAKDASAHGFITDQPDGYNTLLGERGSGLSGGQKQRIAIARACLRNAPILILDEATSALDSESEAQVHEAITRLAKDRTTIIIAHRFSSIRDADRILVFEKGPQGAVITGDGTHEHLAETNPVYKAFCEKQSLQ